MSRSWSPVGTVQDRSTLPLRSVLGVCHWQTAPEAAAETAALGRRSWLRAASFCLACRLGRPLGNVPPGRSGPALGVRDRTGQAAFLRSARAGPSTQVGWRQVKVSSTFSKVVGFGVKPQDLQGVARGAAPAFPYSQKGGTDVPLLGCHRARGFCLWKGQAQCLRARSRGYLLRSVRPVRCTFFSGCAG